MYSSSMTYAVRNRQSRVLKLLLIFLALSSLQIFLSSCATTAPKEPSSSREASNKTTLSNEQLEQRIVELESRMAAFNEKLNLMGGAPSVSNTTADHLPNLPQPPLTSSLPTQVVKTPIASQKLSTATQISQSEPVDRYREAKILFDSKKYSDANFEFNDFIKNYPQHPLASMAQYYIGQSYYEQKEYLLAEEEWEKGLKNYPQSQAVPDYHEGLLRVSKMKPALSTQKPQATTGPTSVTSENLLKQEELPTPQIKSSEDQPAPSSTP